MCQWILGHPVCNKKIYENFQHSKETPMNFVLNILQEQKITMSKLVWCTTISRVPKDNIGATRNSFLCTVFFIEIDDEFEGVLW